MAKSDYSEYLAERNKQLAEAILRIQNCTEGDGAFYAPAYYKKIQELCKEVMSK